jgi:MoaA/NifB/PqqE/SkfB family radical SAM enzyme
MAKYKFITVDIVDACNSRCKTCPRGKHMMPQSTDLMDYDMFKKIILRAITQERTSLDLFNWGEPLLHPKVGLFVKYAVDHNMRVVLSTNLSLPYVDRLEEALMAGASHVIVSHSGFTQQMHEINHLGTDIELVKRNLEEVARFMDENGLDKKVICLRYLKFDYNESEIELSRAFADDLGIDFEILDAVGSPNAPDTYYQWIFNPSTFDPKEPYKYIGGICHQISANMVVDCRGDAWLCCCKPYLPGYKIGNYLNDSEIELTLRRLSHPKCNTCGFHRVTNREFLENINLR